MESGSCVSTVRTLDQKVPTKLLSGGKTEGDPKEMVAKAEASLSPTWFHRLLGLVPDRSEAVEFFQKASRLYRLKGEPQKSLESIQRAELYAEQTQLLSLQREALELTLHFGMENEILTYAQLVSNGCVLEGHFSQAYRIFEKIAVFYDQQHKHNEACDYAGKAIELSQTEKISNYKTTIILVRNLICLEKYENALEAGRAFLETTQNFQMMELFNKREVSFLVGLIEFLLDQENPHSYDHLDAYQIDVLKACRERNLEEFSHALCVLDKVRPLTREQTILCLAVQKRLSSLSFAWETEQPFENSFEKSKNETLVWNKVAFYCFSNVDF